MPNESILTALVPPIGSTEARRLLGGVSRNALQRLIKSGALQAYRLGDGSSARLRFWPEDLKACCRPVTRAG